MTKRVLILATKDSPYSYLAIKTLVKNNVPLYGVALGEKGVGVRALEIWNERTDGRLAAGDFDEFQSEYFPFFTFPSHADETFKIFVKEHKIDLLVNAGTPCILKQDILDAPRIGVLNVHPSILPDYRGCTTMEWSVLNDDPLGNTAHFMVSAIDEGPIIDQEIYQFKKSDGYTDIRRYIYMFNVELMARTIRKIIDNDIAPQSLTPQGEGTYWDVMDDVKLALVKEKLHEGRYKYQR
ncbi:MAG: hypothetical protein COA45_03715 [Zetaproteobacteria bacterium]|nr:MAG: hypothetical protein COA45_03715 [Zetaproteobacteria bacterium]